MGERDTRWERLRILAGAALIVVCGISLWRNSVRPLVDRGVGGGDVVREVRLGVYRWALERKRAELQKEEQEERAKQARAREASGVVRGGSGSAVGSGTRDAGP